MMIQKKLRSYFQPTSQKEKGFTVVELLLYMGLFMGFMIVLSGLFVSTLDVQSEATITSKIDQDSWYLLRRLQYDLYRADAIIVPGENGVTTTSLTLDIDGTPLTYNLVDNQLEITDSATVSGLLSDQVEMSNISFTRLGNASKSATIKVEFELYDVVNPTDNRQIQTTVGVR